MNENGADSPGETLICGRCAAERGPADHFCRQCGLAFGEQHLPSVRNPSLPAVWRPSVPATVARGAAVVAAGKIAEFLLRRLARGVFQRSGTRSAKPARRSAEVVHHDEALPDDATIVSEAFFLRRIRVRR